MKSLSTLALVAPLALLAACGEEPAPEPTPVATPTPEGPTLPAPDQALFTEVFAATCPAAEPVSTANCQRGLGSDLTVCEFGLGEDDVLRHEATLEPDESGENWQLADAETVCSEHDSHHVDN